MTEMPKTAGQGRNRKFPSRSDGSSVNSADIEPNQTDFRGRAGGDELPEVDDMYQLPTLFSLITQRYEGETCEGQLHGNGVASFEGGHTYKGVFAKGLMNGPGVFTWADGLRYEGDFVCNIPMGQGAYTWPNGSSYKGEVYNGIRHGTGSYKCANSGVLYRGQWDQGKRHGKGEVYYNQGESSWYKGDWVKNSREGFGERCYPSGNIYSGEWKNSLRHGEGTMRWLKLGEEYVGMWQEGIQHGRGTHVWILRRVDGSQYSQSNRYTGDFVQGQRHGQGTFFYAGGATYEGEWKNNKKHGEGKFTFKDGHVFEGEFVDDQMKTPSLNGNIAPTPLCGVAGSDSDMPLNIECLLDKFPQRKRNTERKQVEFVVMRKDTELRSIYSFYSRLGYDHSPDNTYLLSHLLLWRLLKDCNIHHHDITLTQIARLIKENSTTQIHSPFTPMPLGGLLRCLVIVAYHIYNRDMASNKYLLAACLSKLMTDDVLPNAKNVKGFLFGQPDLSVVAMKYTSRCWEVYQAYSAVHAAPSEDQTMTCRHLLWMFKDLRLLDNKLTTVRLLKIITADSRDPNNLLSCLNLEITFLEFFEVLLCCAEVKCQQVSKSPEESHSLSRSDDEAGDLSEAEDSEKILQTASSLGQSMAECSDTAELSPAQDILESQQEFKTEVNERHQSAGETRGIEAKQETIHQFFNHFFFPAFEHHQLVTENTTEDKHPSN
ncbi:radial spoke head 10 homolog B isoform X2 [Scophthalmus maximus]|uniref:radial spoke head 10 homolog B isoform X2 n=1 Tax=Scophthalmus maximus TaxID=52904 RepID=UPI0015E104A5|nr:radial spoke head 10 homolog B isoform X2 [Scophthalmus maximus]